MSNDKVQYNGQNGNGYQPLPCAATPPPGPEVDAPTLADAQPGGRVRLGDRLVPHSRQEFNEWWSAQPSDISRLTTYEVAATAYRGGFTSGYMQPRAALSAQPSPGGQGDARSQFEEYRGGDFERDAQGYYTNARTAQDWAMWQAALAARQPVEESVEADVYCAIADMIEPYVQREGVNPDGVLPASVHDSVAILLDHWVKTRQPVGEPVAFMVRWKTEGGFGLEWPKNMQYFRDRADEYEIVPLQRAAPPAQAVDLGRWSQRHADDLHVAVHTALSVHAGSLSQKKRAAISAYVKRLLIDSQAVGNGQPELPA